MIYVRPQEVVSVWAGFGGAITEASAYNYSLLPPARKKAFLKAYFEDLGYTWGRVSIGSNDFCLAPFEYTASAKLDDFSIEHDRQYVLPLLRDIYKVQPLTLVAAPWSPPSFMKTNKQLTRGGRLKKRYYRAYARYLRLFLEAYAKEGFPVDFLSIQNEPEAAQRWESCRWTLAEQHRFIYDHLAPELTGSDTQIIAWDHNREKLLKVAEALLPASPEDAPKVTGLGFHIYSGTHPEQMRLTHAKFPGALLVNTESCAAYAGDWLGAAECYARDILACLNSGVNAYLDWNLLLDARGGPTWAENPVKSPLILTEDCQNFARTPIYDYLKVLSRAFPPGTKIVRTVDQPPLLAAAGVYDGKIRTVLLNPTDQSHKFTLDLAGFKITGMITPHAILQR